MPTANSTRPRKHEDQEPQREQPEDVQDDRDRDDREVVARRIQVSAHERDLPRRRAAMPSRKSVANTAQMRGRITGSVVGEVLRLDHEKQDGGSELSRIQVSVLGRLTRARSSPGRLDAEVFPAEHKSAPSGARGRPR